MVALVVSAQNFDESRGVPFARFAAIRIRGAIMDELRGMDWAARSVRSRAREADTARCAARRRSSAARRAPDEIAAAMGISVKELDDLDADLSRAGVLSMQSFAPETGAATRLRLDRRPRADAAAPRAAGLPARRDRRAARPAARGRHRILLPRAQDDRHRRRARRHRVAGVADAGRGSRPDEGTAWPSRATTASEQASLGRAAAARAAYSRAVSMRSSLSDRLSVSSVRGDVSAVRRARTPERPELRRLLKSGSWTPIGKACRSTDGSAGSPDDSHRLRRLAPSRDSIMEESQ